MAGATTGGRQCPSVYYALEPSSTIVRALFYCLLATEQLTIGDKRAEGSSCWEAPLRRNYLLRITYTIP